MSLSSVTLATELENLTPSSSESTSRTAFSQAYGDYMKDAETNSIPIITAPIDSTCVPAMAAAMSFDEGFDSHDAADEMIKGFKAFWNVMVASPAAFFAGATVITRPSFGGSFPDDLGDEILDNTDNSENLEQAAANIAAQIHSATDNQGTATFPGPVTFPIT